MIPTQHVNQKLHEFPLDFPQGSRPLMFDLRMFFFNARK